MAKHTDIRDNYFFQGSGLSFYLLLETRYLPLGSAAVQVPIWPLSVHFPFCIRMTVVTDGSHLFWPELPHLVSTWVLGIGLRSTGLPEKGFVVVVICLHAYFFFFFDTGSCYIV